METFIESRLKIRADRGLRNVAEPSGTCEFADVPQLKCNSRASIRISAERCGTFYQTHTRAREYFCDVRIYLPHILLSGRRSARSAGPAKIGSGMYPNVNLAKIQARGILANHKMIEGGFSHAC
jgi:hypothetical protein